MRTVFLHLAVLAAACLPVGTRHCNAQPFDDASVVASWDLPVDSPATALKTMVPKTVGSLREGNGPRSPEFPGFDPANRAVCFDGRGGRIISEQPHLTFTGGDTISISAWVAPRRASDTSPKYIIGKGRTGNKGFRKDNQNWALRLVPKGDRYQLSFLFATADGKSKVNWHRWNSRGSLGTSDGWHHVAITYHFGKPDSMRAWIDATETDGNWAMAGPTQQDPIVDEDEVWIGSASNGSRGNSFHGSIDMVTIARGRLTDNDIASLYQRDDSIARITHVDKPKMPDLKNLPVGKVRLTMHEKLPFEDRWPEAEDLEQLSPPDVVQGIWHSDAFLLERLPIRFDGWGIRSAWKSPSLLRIAADVELPTGRRRYLLRARSLGRLWIDGHLVAETKYDGRKAPSGEEPITPLAEPPFPGLRDKGYRQQEVIAEHTVAADHNIEKGQTNEKLKRCRVVLELVVGGKNCRTETGEVTVAVETPRQDSFDVLVPAGGSLGSLSLECEAAKDALLRRERRLRRWETEKRRQLASSQDAFWANRRRLVGQWLSENPAPKVPAVEGVSHPIDAFLQHRIDEYQERNTPKSAPNGNPPDQHFLETVQPLLQEHCLRCHGHASKGGLRLDSREGAIKGGDSTWAAVVPGEPDESELMLRLETDDPSTRMPPEGDALSELERAKIARWIRDGAAWPKPSADERLLVQTDRIDDAAFLRRVYLDSIGIPPTENETREFLASRSPNRRHELVARLLDGDRVADQLMPEWLDRLAENPTLLNKSLNSTGPFRWFLFDAFLDRKPMDRIVTELILMRGDTHTGGSAGFGVAGENDSPMAAKAHVLGSAFLGIELQCARCHDSPFHSTTQEDLFSMAAMLNRKPLSVPDTSRVPDAFFENQQRASLIEVTLALGRRIEPNWTLARLAGIGDDQIDQWVLNPDDSRERLAALITSPTNQRFARVLVNHVWTRLMGVGLVSSPNDWEHTPPSHPQLLDWLAYQFVENGYEIRHVMQLIMTSDVYSRRSVQPPPTDYAGTVFFAAPFSRRMSAEQVVDSLLHASGRTMDCEELTFVHDGRRPLSNRLTLGTPTRAWMMGTLNNERDRPSLSLPKARAIADVLKAFGWSGSRQKPIHKREVDANVLQPGILSNGAFSMSLTRASVGSSLSDLALNATDCQTLVDSLYLRFLTRFPTGTEREYFSRQLELGFTTRLIPSEEQTRPQSDTPLPLVHWFNHLRPAANEIQQERERRVRQGPPVDLGIAPEWRERFEDVVWSLVNHDEFVWIP